MNVSNSTLVFSPSLFSNRQPMTKISKIMCIIKITCLKVYSYVLQEQVVKVSYSLTPTQCKIEQPSFTKSSVEYFNQQKVEHNTLTQHPGKHSSKEIVQQSSYYCASNL